MDSFLARLFGPVKAKSRRGRTRKPDLAAKLRLVTVEDRLAPATFTVTALGDNTGVNPPVGGGTGTLRQAIVDANAAAGPDVIDFDATLFATSKTISLEASLPAITGGLTVSGPGVSRVNISGAGQHQVFSSTTAGLALTVQDVTVSGGSSAAGGGGLRAPAGANINLNRVTFSGNVSATGSGGGVFMTGGTLTITDSTFSGNTAGNNGGGVHFENTGTLVITGSTFNGNITTTAGDNIGGAGVRMTGSGNITLTNSTFHANNTQGSGGGILMVAYSGNLTLNHSTFTQNAAGNTAGGQGGGGLARTTGAGSITLYSTIVSTNNSTNAPDILMVGGEVVADYSAIGSNTGFALSAASGGIGPNLGFGAALNLGALKNNGGPTFTRLPANNSPAVNAGPTVTNGVNTDQRGNTFVRRYAAAIDIGAVETQTSTLVSITTTAPDPTNQTSITYLITFNQPTQTINSSNFATVENNLANTAFINPPIPVDPLNPIQWTIVVNNITANAPSGTIGLNMVNSTGTNPTPILLPTPPGAPTTPIDTLNPFVGPVRTIDQTAPVVNSITRAGANPATGPVVFTVTFNEPVSGVTAANFTIVRTGTVAGGTIAVTPNAVPSTTWTVTVSGYTGNGTLGLNLTSTTGITDAATNPLSTVGVPLVGEVYAVGSPTVLSILPAVTSTNAATVTYTITFSQVVNGLTAANLDLLFTGLATTNPSIVGGSVTPVGGAPTATWTVAVNTGGPEGTLRLRVISGTGVTNPTTSSTVAGPFPYVGGVVTVDRTSPTLVSIVRQTPPVGGTGDGANTPTVTFRLTFSEPVVNLTLNDVAPVVTGLTGVTEASITSVGAGDVWDVVVNTGSGVGTLGLNMTGTGAVTDTATNALSNAGIPFTGEVYRVDLVTPTVVSIARQTPPLIGTSSNTNANSVDFLVTFSEDMVPGSVADFDLITTGTSAGAGVTAVNPGPNPNQYVVTVATGDTEGTIQLQFVGGGASSDLFTNDVSNDGFADQLYTVDTVEPVVASVARATQRDTNLAQVQFTVTFSEPVATLTAGNLSLFTTGTLANTSILSVAPVGGAPAAAWTVTVSTGIGDGLLRLDVDTTAGLADTFTNVVTPLPFQTGEDYNVDTTLPTIVSIALGSPNPTNLPGVNYTVVFSEPVLNVTTGNFTLATTGAITGASINSVNGSGTTWTIGVLTGAGSGTVRLDLSSPTGITDAATNGLVDTEVGPDFTIDKSNPSIVSIARQVPTNAATNLASVTYRVVFTEPVAGVSLTNFGLTTLGVAGASITSVAQAGANAWDVVVNTGSGNGTVRLDLTNPIGVADLAGNPLSVTRQGDVYTIDKIAPSATITRTVTQADPATGEPVQFTVVFSEPVFGLTGAGFQLGGTANPTSVTVTGTGNSYVISVTGMTDSGTVVASVLAGAATDAAGSPNLASGLASVNFLQSITTGFDLYRTLAGKALSVPASQGVLANDAALSGGNLTATLVQGPPASEGTLTLLPNGGFVFTPAVGFSGSTSFTYRASDGTTTSQPTTATINVTSQTVRLAAGAGVGGGPMVVVYDASGALLTRFFAYAPEFTGGVQVAVGDINDDGIDDIVVGTGVGGAPHVKVFDGVTFAEIASFFAYESSFRGGVQVAVGDINGDGKAEVVTGTGKDGGPRVRSFSGQGFNPISDFFAFEESFRGGVNVAVGDTDGDGVNEVLASPGFGGGTVVKVFNPLTRQEKLSFLSYGPTDRAGVAIAVGDVFADGVPDILVGPGVGSTVRTFRGTDGLQTSEILDAFPQANGGVRVGGKDTNNDNVNDQLLIATGQGDTPRVYRFDLKTMTRVDELFGFPLNFTGGIYVG